MSADGPDATIPTWGSVLDDFERRLDSVAAALTSGDWPAFVLAFTPPAQVAGEPEAIHRTRYADLARRGVALEAQVRSALAEAGRLLGDGDQKRRAVRDYLSHA